MELGPIGLAAAQTGVSLTRFNYAVFGWPFAFVFMPFAGWRSHRSWIPWTMLLCFVVTHFYLRNGGIDTFGPVHYLELALPVILLTALGITRLSSWSRADHVTSLPAGPSKRAPLALCLGLITASAFGYSPVRAMGVHEIGSITGLPVRTAEATLQKPTIVFTPRPFVPRHCSGTHHFNFWRPNNDPDLQNRVLWVNHLTLEHDERLMELHPDREAVVMVWSSQCTPAFLPLSGLDETRVPPGSVGGSGELPSVEEMR